MVKPDPKWALITGASQGLGRSLAEECAARGMNLFLVALPESGLPELCRSIASEWNVDVEWLEADLTEPSTPDRLLSLIRSKGCGIDLLVNNAGVSSIGFFSSSDLGSHEATIELNVLALVRLTHLLIPELASRESARILNVGSLSSYFPMPFLPVYSATKSFVVSFSLALRTELSGSIGVSVLCPNTIRAPGQVQDFIERQGLLCRLACLYPQRIAREALDGVFRGKAVIVPGFINRVVRVLASVAPRALVVWVVRRYWGGYGADTGLVSPEAQEAGPAMFSGAGRVAAGK